MSDKPETVINEEETSETLETFKTFNTFETIATVDPENSETLETFKTLNTFETIDSSAVAAPAAPVAPAAAPVPTAPVAPAVPSAPVATAAPAPASAPVSAENTNPGGRADREIVLTNIMEEIIRMEAIKIMQGFDMCRCEKCLYDVMAFALNSMPARYVVSHRGALFAKIASYGNQYRTDIISSLTQACNIVKQSPHHP